MLTMFGFLMVRTMNRTPATIRIPNAFGIRAPTVLDMFRNYITTRTSQFFSGPQHASTHDQIHSQAPPLRRSHLGSDHPTRHRVPRCSECQRRQSQLPDRRDGRRVGDGQVDQGCQETQVDR